MDIGDIVKNNYTTLDNPYHFLIFIGWTGNNRKCLCYDGRVVNFSKPRKGEKEFLEVIDHFELQDLLLGHELRKELFRS